VTANSQDTGRVGDADRAGVPAGLSPQAVSSEAAHPSRTADLELALDYAVRVLVRTEPPDARFMSDEFVAAASILANLPNDKCRQILRAFVAADEAEIAAQYDAAALTFEAGQ
jgi:hypothetical protein